MRLFAGLFGLLLLFLGASFGFAELLRFFLAPGSSGITVGSVQTALGAAGTSALPGWLAGLPLWLVLGLPGVLLALLMPTRERERSFR